MQLKAAVEALILASNGITLERLVRILEKEPEEIKRALEELKKEYENEAHGVVLREVNGRYRFFTKPEYADFVSSCPEGSTKISPMRRWKWWHCFSSQDRFQRAK